MPIVRSHGEYFAKCARCNELSDSFLSVKELYTKLFVRKEHEWGNLPVVGTLCSDCSCFFITIMEVEDKKSYSN